MKNRIVLWIVAIVIAGCTAISQLAEYDPAIQEVALWIGSILTAVFATSTLPGIPDWVRELMIRILKGLPDLIKAMKKTPPDKKKTIKMQILLWILFLSIIVAGSGCAVNYYDEALRNTVLEQREKMIDGSLIYAKDSNGIYKYSVNYLAGFYRLALLGEGKLSEDEIVDKIEAYKEYLTALRIGTQTQPK